MNKTILILILSLSLPCFSQNKGVIDLDLINKTIDTIIDRQIIILYPLYKVGKNTTVLEQYDRYKRIDSLYCSVIDSLLRKESSSIIKAIYAQILANHNKIELLEELFINELGNGESLIVPHTGQFVYIPLNEFIADVYYDYYCYYKSTQIGVSNASWPGRTTIDSLILWNDTISSFIQKSMLVCYNPQPKDRIRLLELHHANSVASYMALVALTKLGIEDDLNIVKELIKNDEQYRDGLIIAMLNPRVEYFELIEKKLRSFCTGQKGRYDSESDLIRMYGYFIEVDDKRTRDLIEDVLSKRRLFDFRESKCRKDHILALTIVMEYYPNNALIDLKKKYKLEFKEWMNMYLY